MKKTLLSLAAMATLLAAAPAHALSFNGVMGGDSEFRDFSTDGLLSFDIDFSSLVPMTLNYTIDAADLVGGALSFNAVLRNFVGTGLEGYAFSLSTGSFANVGTAWPGFDGGYSVNFNGSNANVSFAQLAYLDTAIGDSLSNGGTNWSIAGLNAGDSLSITVAAVPEPETYALLLSGLGMVGWLSRRRKPQAQLRA